MVLTEKTGKTYPVRRMKDCKNCKNFMKKGYENLIMAGYVLSVGFSFLLLLTFFKAYFHETNKVIVDVNYFGEAHAEAILLPATFVVILAGLYVLSRKFNGK